MTEHSESLYDLVIIGGGPAGFTAGIYAARASLKVLLIEGVTTISQITSTDMMENYPGVEEVNGMELVQRFRKQAEKFGLEIAQGDVSALEKGTFGSKEVWKVIASRPYTALAVIIATGAAWRKLGVPGEKELTGKGVSYCATCDGPFYRGRVLIVVGGGDTAIQEALFLTNFAARVIIVHRRGRLRAAKILQATAFAHDKMEFVWDSVVEEISGKNFVEAVTVKNLKTGKATKLAADGVFLFVGLSPNTDAFRGVVELDESGYIIVNSNMQTSTPGIFAAGDCIAKLFRQVITACGDGATAAYSAQLYLEKLKGETY